MFEQAAQEKIQQFDDDSEEDIWEEKPISFDKTAQQNRSRSEFFLVPESGHVWGVDHPQLSSVFYLHYIINMLHQFTIFGL